MKFKVKNTNPFRPLSKTGYQTPEYLTIEQLPSGKWDSFEILDLNQIPERPTQYDLRLLLEQSGSYVDSAALRVLHGFPERGQKPAGVSGGRLGILRLLLASLQQC